MPSQRSQVPERRMTIPQGFLVANGQDHGPVQLQGDDHGSSSWAESHQTNPVPAEMKSPRVAAWIKQGRNFAGLRIACSQPRSFAQRAGDTSQSEIIKNGFSTGVDGHHMIHMEGGFLAGLSQTAIFASVFGSLNNQPPQMRRNAHALTSIDGLTAETGAATARSVRQDPPILRPRASRRRSGNLPRPACRAGREAASRRLWATETGRDRPASAPQVGSLDSYAFYLSLAHSTGQETCCPSLKTLLHLNAPKSAKVLSAEC